LGWGRGGGGGDGGWGVARGGGGRKGGRVWGGRGGASAYRVLFYHSTPSKRVLVSKGCGSKWEGEGGGKIPIDACGWKTAPNISGHGPRFRGTKKFDWRVQTAPIPAVRSRSVRGRGGN